jgi:MFS family permease
MPGAAARRRLGATFWRLFGAAGISSLGDGLVLVGFPLLALSLTTDPLLIAGVSVAGRLPALLFSVPAGAVVDRIDRRRLVAAVNTVRTLALVGFGSAVLASGDNLPALYATVFVLGTGDMVFSVATQASLPGMVAAADLPQANGYLVTADVTGSQFVGPALGGLAFSAARSLPFLADAASFVASGFVVRTALPKGKPRGEQPAFLSDVRDGLRFFFRHRLLRALALVVASLAFCQAMVFAELVLYGTRQLHLSHVGYGLFFAGASAGNIIGSLGAGRIHAWLGPARCIIGAAVISGAAYLLLSVTSQPVTATLVLCLEAVAVAVGNVTTVSLRQRVIPAHLMGRVGSAFRLLLYGLIPIGAITGGAVTSAAGLRTAFRVAGGLQLAVFAVAAPMLMRRIRQTEPARAASPPA